MIFQEVSQKTEILEQNSFFYYLVSLTPLLPLNLYFILEFFDNFFCFMEERQFLQKNPNSFLAINYPHFFQNFTNSKYIILNKNNLCYSDQYQIKGAIIQNRFFKITSKELSALSIDTIKTNYLTSREFFIFK